MTSHSMRRIGTNIAYKGTSPRNRRDTNGSTTSVPPYLPDGAGAIEERAEPGATRPHVPASTPGSDRTDPRRDSFVEPPLPRPVQMPATSTSTTTTTPSQLPLPTLSQSLPSISHLPAYQAPPTQPVIAAPNYTQATMLNPWAYQQPLRMTSDVVYSYYPFLSITNLHNIPAQDANFLESQDCLRVPTRAVMNEFLQQYFLHVHPLLPLFNEGDFWDMYLNEGLEKLGLVRGRMSLLVLQSLLFATCNVSMSSRDQCGVCVLTGAVRWAREHQGVGLSEYTCCESWLV